MERHLLPLFVFCCGLLGACATSLEPNEFSLEEMLAEDTAISVPMRVTEKGMIVVEGAQLEGQSVDMVLDTGATQSAIFETTLDRLNLDKAPTTNTMVHGMVSSKFRRVVNVPKMEIGPLIFPKKPLVILDDRETNILKGQTYDGLIGMDVLSKYQIYISPAENELKLIPIRTPVNIASGWSLIPLIKNPFKEDGRELHFINVRVAGRITPALLDTGSEFSALNWEAANYSQLRQIRRKLRDAWELQGAVGLFKPTTRVKMERVRSGQVFWTNKEFVVIDFESLEVLGINDQPFMIAGMNLFADDTVFIDFNRDFLAIIPDETPVNAES